MTAYLVSLAEDTSRASLRIAETFSPEMRLYRRRRGYSALFVAGRDEAADVAEVACADDE
ncbi:hypothetical protein [Thermogemmatispora sp.]|uniref:hypothetical protein n=1 Tax=Thermogemmatispora sp. TaxID=1968838 RepID=UPI001DADF793|nr:hypothetical protein [Thermogemmatispora sp.]MBX5451829.1 hypothetical protein [Thermogemmatispora sp.]